MKIQNFQTARRFLPEKMQKLNLFESPRLFLDVYCLEPMQSQSPHAHVDSDKIYAVLEGQVVASIGDESSSLSPGEVLFCPAGQPHGIENRSAERAAVLVFMAPHPAFKG